MHGFCLVLKEAREPQPKKSWGFGRCLRLAAWATDGTMGMLVQKAQSICEALQELVAGKTTRKRLVYLRNLIIQKIAFCLGLERFFPAVWCCVPRSSGIPLQIINNTIMSASKHARKNQWLHGTVTGRISQQSRWTNLTFLKSSTYANPVWAARAGWSRGDAATGWGPACSPVRPPIYLAVCLSVCPSV